MDSAFTQSELTLFQRMGIIKIPAWTAQDARARELMQNAYRRLGMAPPEGITNDQPTTTTQSNTADSSSVSNGPVAADSVASSENSVASSLASGADFISGWLGPLAVRGVVIVLGFIFVALGLAMFGRVSPVTVVGKISE